MRAPETIFPLLLCGLSLAAQNLPAHAPGEKGVIEGRVTDAVNGTALAAVEILAYKGGLRDSPLLVITDSGGHFTAEDLDPGRYRLVAQHNGYATQQYGERAQNREGIRVTLAAGQTLSDIDFRLLPTGVVTGHVFGEGNQPHVGTTVAALSLHYVNGQQRLAIDNFVLTNDLGEYRLFGIRPGHYYIAAFEPNRLGTVRLPKDAPPEERYGISFYPDAIDPAKASSINIQPGSELNGAEIYLARRRAFHVRGRVSGAERGAQQVNVQLEPLVLGTAITTGEQDTTPDGRGVFEFSGITPGQYVISAGFTIGGKNYRAWKPVEIDDSDVDMFITPHTEINIQGRMGFTERKDVDLRTVSLKFHPTFSSGMGIPEARISADGSFNAYVSGDIYNLEISSLPDDSYVESIRVGEQDATDRVLDLSAFMGAWIRVELTLNPNGGRIEGTVADENHQPVAGATVLLVPGSSYRKQLYLFRAANTDRNGRFSIRGIVPGDYELLAWEDIESGAWENPDFLSTFEDRAEKITLQPSGHETRSLAVIPAAVSQ